jgi:hypothetical protein
VGLRTLGAAHRRNAEVSANAAIGQVIGIIAGWAE